jgi:hypothetical protein
MAIRPPIHHSALVNPLGGEGRLRSEQGGIQVGFSRNARRHVARRIAAILLLDRALDASYAAAKGTVGRTEQTDRFRAE